MAARVTQEVIEVLYIPDARKARVTQEVVEALYTPDARKARATQLVLEVLQSESETETPPPAAVGRSMIVIAG